MLRLARIEQGAESGAPRSFRYHRIDLHVRSGDLAHASAGRSANIALELVNPTAVHLHADPEDLELIWVNLLENAVHYSPPGSKVMRAHRSGTRRGGARIRGGFRPGHPARGIAATFSRDSAAAILRARGRRADSVWGWRFARPW